MAGGGTEGHAASLRFVSALKLAPCQLVSGAAAHISFKSRRFNTGTAKASALTVWQNTSGAAILGTQDNASRAAACPV